METSSKSIGKAKANLIILPKLCEMLDAKGRQLRVNLRPNHKQYRSFVNFLTHPHRTWEELTFACYLFEPADIMDELESTVTLIFSETQRLNFQVFSLLRIYGPAYSAIMAYLGTTDIAKRIPHLEELHSGIEPPVVSQNQHLDLSTSYKPFCDYATACNPGTSRSFGPSVSHSGSAPAQSRSDGHTMPEPATAAGGCTCGKGGGGGGCGSCADRDRRERLRAAQAARDAAQSGGEPDTC